MLDDRNRYSANLAADASDPSKAVFVNSPLALYRRLYEKGPWMRLSVLTAQNRHLSYFDFLVGPRQFTGYPSLRHFAKRASWSGVQYGPPGGIAGGLP